MANRSTALLGHFWKLLNTRDDRDRTDGLLLERFVVQLDESAFATLVERHGPLVLNLCRRLLGHAQDAEDAFQATFLVLIRKARTLDRRGSLAGWLYGVAYRIAVRARANAARQRTLERQAVPMEHTYTDLDPPDPELREAIDQELSRLPEKYRTPIVLCYLEGKTHVEAAQQLNWPVGTVRGRMARARTLLRRRLARRGLALPMATFAATLTAGAATATVPPILARAIVNAAILAAKGGLGGAFSTQAVALSDAILREMFTAKLKMAAALLLGITLVASGAGVVTYQLHQNVQGRTSVPEAPQTTTTHSKKPLTPLHRFLHDGPVTALAFTPDSLTLLSASADATIRLWDTASGKERQRWPRQHHEILAIALTPDGNRLASGSKDNKVRLWEIGMGTAVSQMDGPPHGAQAIAYSPDDKFLAAAGLGQSIQLWDLRGHHKHQLPGHPHGINSLAFSPDSRLLASAGGDRLIHLWDLAAGKELHPLQGHEGSVTCVAFVPDSNSLFSASEDGTIRRWDTHSGKELARFQGHQAGVSSLALSRDGSILITGSSDGTIRVWKTASGKQFAQADAHKDGVATVAIARDGKTVASGGKDHAIILWNLAVQN
jgi:RNA polymerase sigma factor (sigma-70 family)